MRRHNTTLTPLALGLLAGAGRPITAFGWALLAPLGLGDGTGGGVRDDDLGGNLHGALPDRLGFGLALVPPEQVHGGQCARVKHGQGLWGFGLETLGDGLLGLLHLGFRGGLDGRGVEGVIVHLGSERFLVRLFIALGVDVKRETKLVGGLLLLLGRREPVGVALGRLDLVGDLLLRNL